LESLIEQGIPTEIAKGYIEGVQTKAQQYESKVQEIAGGKDEYAKLTSWALANTDAEFQKSFNDLVYSGDLAKAQMAVDALKIKYQQAVGQPQGKLIEGTSAAPAVGDVYESMQQALADINSKEYSRDPAFRDKVAKKLHRSKLF
jgi:hypothetical protein